MIYSRETIDKLGNAMVYIAEHVPDLSKTKLLKLIYLLEEVSVKKYQLPFFGIPFEVWQAGPVAKDINDQATYEKAKTTFNDDEFSDNDIEVMNYVIEKYGHKTATQLVKYLHKKIDFTYYLSGCGVEKYKDCMEFHQSISHLKP